LVDEDEEADVVDAADDASSYWRRKNAAMLTRVMGAGWGFGRMAMVAFTVEAVTSIKESACMSHTMQM
jgi:hypothetical protein